jgi:hypothetical protein
LAINYNDDSIIISIVIQSLELTRELLVTPSAEQAVKVPLQPLHGSLAGDSAKCDNHSVSAIFPVSPRLHSISPQADFLHSESVQATAG